MTQRKGALMEIILIFLVILWFLGYLSIPGIAIPQFPLFYINSLPITLWDVFIFLVVVWAIDAAPSPLREIFVVLLLLWLLSTFGIIAIAGFSQIAIIAIIFGLIVALFRRPRVTIEE
jgi:hypothetical protein